MPWKMIGYDLYYIKLSCYHCSKIFFPAVDRIDYDNRMIFISICIDMVVNINRRLDCFSESDQNVFGSLMGV